MQTKHLIMGTAGHVDHGKTSLIRALTGFDCDTHQQEKQRGITINLGFTNINLPSGNTVGIVDVPGHADFINTMVSGACGIDFVLLVIAADEGIMPQTREHLQIMELLGIRKGLIVLNKSDLVDEELLELAEDEVRDTVQKTFLESASVVCVSSLTSMGINELITQIDEMVTRIPERDAAGNFRMYIDRIFSVEGFGVIVNGSILDGKISISDSLYILPGEREVRIRRIERYGQQVESVQAGDRASLNLVGFKQKEFFRGMLLSDKKIAQSRLIDARIRMFPSEKSLPLWSQVVLLLGTMKQMVRMHLLDRDVLTGGDEGLVQIYLPQPVIPVLGDKFIIRLSSGDETLGGGIIIDPYPLHHRRRRQKQIDIVQMLASGELPEIIASEVRKSILPLSLSEISAQINQPLEKLSEIVYAKLPPDLLIYQGGDKIILLMKKQKTVYINKILNSVRQFHNQNPLSRDGRSFQELLGIFGIQVTAVCRDYLLLLLQEMESSFKLRKEGKTWVLFEHKVEIKEDFQKKIAAINDFLYKCGYNVPLMSGIIETAEIYAISDKDLKLILQKLVKEEEVIFYQSSYIHIKIVNQARARLISYLKQHEEGISLAQYRTLLDTNRKMASLLLEYFDTRQITARKDNVRHFTPQYKKYLQS
ncbi:MAG: selenocysteine-specific translation elongation factor [Candidatus Cloacimonetes bacterium]|nr:selenocysteine-specific translation elongation factor [Candidatus Cloacimonadota bacterium]